MSTEPKCPFHQTAGGGTTNRDWWPDSLRLDLLHQHSSKSDPMGADFDYAEASAGSRSPPAATFPDGRRRWSFCLFG